MPDHSDYWKRKLSAFFHDTPDKVADIKTHEQRAARIRNLFRDLMSFQKTADFDAAAADRLPFPDSKVLRQDLAELRSIPHPMGGSRFPIEDFKSPAQAEEIAAKSMPFLVDDVDPKAAFICSWRFWRNWASSVDSRFAVLPADTRIPDHTIWHHLSITTAFQGSLPLNPSDSIDDAPRLLLFSIGPVQDFIAAARSTRDLWSGSYLLSYLISGVLGNIALTFGPDHVLFPNLLDQPLVDLRLRDKVFSRHSFGDNRYSIWKGFDYTEGRLTRLLTPSLPNRFMALLPAKDHDGRPIDAWIDDRVKDLKGELTKIAESVRDYLVENGVDEIAAFDADRFIAQTRKLLEVHWQTLPIPSTLDELEEWMTVLPDEEELSLDKGQSRNNGNPVSIHQSPRQAFEAIREMIKIKDCTPQYKLRTTSNWAGLNTLLSFLHDGAKASRVFDAWRGGRWESGLQFNKDALNGREEAVLMVGVTKEELDGEESAARTRRNEDKLKTFCTKLEMSEGTLKENELLGASTLIKRFWWHTELPKIIECKPRKLREAHPMPNTHSIAAGRPFDSDAEQESKNKDDDKYFAVLALDGDEMGKWISGWKTPPLKDCLSPKTLEFYEEINRRKNDPTSILGFLQSRRTLNPSWHLQFSEALGNFAFHAAQRIVEAFDGRLIYAGGDDVLAMLPAKDAIPCARALRAAFRGEKELASIKGALHGQDKSRKSDRKTRLFASTPDGYLQLDPAATRYHGDRSLLLSDPVNFPVLVPGPNADVSVGIAIAHCKSPLQDVVRAAQAAEKRAKGELGRGAIAVSLFKRSGEITEWGCKWALSKEGPDSASFTLLSTLIQHLGPDGALNARFPHKLEALLTPYLPTSDQIECAGDFESNFRDVLLLELDHCLTRNEGGTLTPEERELFAAAWEETKDASSFERRLHSLINLLRVAAWMRRGTPSPQER